MPVKPFITVSIVTYNNIDTIGETLSSVFTYTQGLDFILYIYGLYHCTGTENVRGIPLPGK